MVCTLTGGALHLIMFFSSLLVFQFTKKKIYIYIFQYTLRPCLVSVIEHTFEHFKQHYTLFHTLFHPHVF